MVRHVALIHHVDQATPADDKFDDDYFLGMLNPMGVGGGKVQWQVLLETAAAETVPIGDPFKVDH